MPTYALRNKETGEESEVYMGISAMDSYLEANPHMETFPIGAPAIGDPVRMGVTKMPTEWRGLLKRIKKNNYRSNIRDR